MCRMSPYLLPLNRLANDLSRVAANQRLGRHVFGDDCSRCNDCAIANRYAFDDRRTEPIHTWCPIITGRVSGEPATSWWSESIIWTSQLIAHFSPIETRSEQKMIVLGLIKVPPPMRISAPWSTYLHASEDPHLSSRLETRVWKQTDQAASTEVITVVTYTQKKAVSTRPPPPV
jgi:hypothetical protein